MDVIRVRNVREALPAGVNYLTHHGRSERTRAGEVLVANGPVTTVYEKPMERVLLSAIRDANPFFHIAESLFYLAGRNDATWLDQFVGDFSARFCEEDGRLHGSYGHRWRKHFDLEWGGHENLPDQLDTIVRLLKENPGDRQAVLTMWDPAADLGVKAKDRPCNLNVMFRIRGDRGDRDEGNGTVPDYDERVLDITVCCRSNDIVWGAYGANAVQFSVLQEYLAARIGVGVGIYYQVSNNYHVYKDVLEKVKGIGNEHVAKYGHAEITPIVTAPELFDEDLDRFFSEGTLDEHIQRDGLAFIPDRYANAFFNRIAEPLYWAHCHWKAKDRKTAFRRLGLMPPNSDWRLAAWDWMARRAAKTEHKAYLQNANGVGEQIGGTHYKAEYQHWDLVVDTDAGYFVGNISKYISRSRKKGGRQDLEKALHYADKWVGLIEEVGSGASLLLAFSDLVHGYSGKLERFAASAGLSFDESRIIALFHIACTLEQARAARDALKEFIGAQPVPLTEENHYAERFSSTLSLSAADKGETF